jgi:hypothetical protein
MEAGMLKPFLLSLAMSAVFAGAVGADESIARPDTWRYSVSRILADQQKRPDRYQTASADVFRQHYERYGATGLPDRPSP